MQEHPDPQSSAILELRDYHAESPPDSPSGSATNGHEYKRELTPVQENPNELGDATPGRKLTTPRQSSLEGEGTSSGKEAGRLPQSTEKYAEKRPDAQEGNQKADKPREQKQIKVAKSPAGNADSKGKSEPQSIGGRVRDAVQGLKHRFESTGRAKVGSDTLKVSVCGSEIILEPRSAVDAIREESANVIISTGLLSLQEDFSLTIDAIEHFGLHTPASWC